MITKGERQELRSIVRQQFKVLRQEVLQREAELLAGVEDEIAAKYSGDDAAWAGVMHEVHEAVMEANRRINDALYQGGYQRRGNTERLWITEPPLQQPKHERQELRHRAASKIRAQVKAAMLKLDRDEADLLRNLGMGALESDEARQFLSTIPAVSELVPASRLAELEASLTDDGATS